MLLMFFTTVFLLKIIDLLKSKGKVPEEHEVVQEMKLINAAFKKFEQATAKKEKPLTNINVPAAKRIITASLSDTKSPS